MQTHIIKMPDIGEGIAEVELVQWHVKPGDQVAEDQVLAEVMTDKASVEVPSPVNGTVISLGGEIGDVLAVGSELIRLEVGADAAAAAEATAAEATPAADTTPAARPQATPPSARAPALAHAPAPALATDSSAAAKQRTDKPVASPAVRQRARQLGIDLHTIEGRGPNDRITHADLDARLSGQAGLAPPGTASGGNTYARRDDEQSIPVRGLRRQIARKMHEAKRRIPHFTYVEELDVTELETLRIRLNEQWRSQRRHLTLLPFLIRAVVLAVRDFPQINAHFDDEGETVIRYGAVHVGIATQTEGGLIVPVLRHAETHDLWSSAAELVRLADATRSGHARPDELSGSTITITSLGALGGIVSTPIINHPEVAIVGINRIVERPVVLNGAIVVRKIMNLSSSFDHRVVDGQHAAQFIQHVRAHLECPARLFIE